MVARVHKDTMNSLILNGASKKMVDDAYNLFIEEKDLYDRHGLCFVDIFSKENPLGIKDNNEKIIAFFNLMDEIKKEDLIKKINSRILGKNKTKYMSESIENIINEKRLLLGSKVVFKKLKDGLKHMAKINSFDDLYTNINSLLNPLTLEEFQNQLDIHNETNKDNAYLEHVVDDLYFMRLNMETVIFFQNFASPSYCTKHNYKTYYENLMSQTSFIWCIDFSREDRFKQFLIYPEFYNKKESSMKKMTVEYIVYDYYNDFCRLNENYEKTEDSGQKDCEANYRELLTLFEKVLPQKNSKDCRGLFSLFKYREDVVDNEFKISTTTFVKMFNLTVEERLFGNSKLLEFFNNLEDVEAKKMERMLSEYLVDKLYNFKTEEFNSIDVKLFESLSPECQNNTMKKIREKILNKDFIAGVESMIAERMHDDFKKHIVSFLELERFLPISIFSTEDIILKIIFNAITEKDIESLRNNSIFFYLIKEVFPITVFSEKTNVKILNMMSKEQICSFDMNDKMLLENKFTLSKTSSFSEVSSTGLSENSFQALKESLKNREDARISNIKSTKLFSDWKESLKIKDLKKKPKKKHIINKLIEIGKKRNEIEEKQNIKESSHIETDDLLNDDCDLLDDFDSFDFSAENPIQLDLFYTTETVNFNLGKKSKK